MPCKAPKEEEKLPVPPEAKVERPKAEPEPRFWSGDLVVMLAGLGFLVASTGLASYLLALFSRT